MRTLRQQDQEETEMLAQFVAIASRSRREMIQDAAGVGLLFTILIGTLYAAS